MFAYCENNPVIAADENGKWVHLLIGTLVGAVVGAVSSVIEQVASGNEINWKEVGVSAATGAASGLLAASGVGLIGAVAGNAAISMAGNAAKQVIKNNGFNNFDVDDMLLDGVIGGISGAVGGNGFGKSVNISTLNQRLGSKIISGSKQAIVNGVKYYASQTSTLYKRYLINPIIRSGATSLGLSLVS